MIAVEPETDNYRLLKKNTRDLKNVTCAKKAIWYKNTWVKVYESEVTVPPGNTPSEGGFFVGDSTQEEGDVQAITINRITDKYQLTDYMVKMDIEGAEYKVFEQGDNVWLKKCKILVIETHDRLSDTNDERKIWQKLETTHDFAKTVGENRVFLRKDYSGSYHSSLAGQMRGLPFWRLADQIDEIERLCNNRNFKVAFRCDQLDSFEWTHHRAGYILWGAGDDGVKAVRLLRLLGKEVKDWCDKEKGGRDITAVGIKIVSPEEALDRCTDEVILIATRKYKTDIMNEMFRIRPDLQDYVS